MKVKRQKKVERILNFYKNNCDICRPFNVIIDATFCRTALQEKVNIRDQIPKYLDDDTKLLTTQCIILEVEQLSKLSSSLYGVWLIVKQFDVVSCGHEGKSIPASMCIRSLISKRNPNKYIVASQDSDLREQIHRKVIATPIIFFHHSAPTLEKPTVKSLEFAHKKMLLCISTHEQLSLANQKQLLQSESEIVAKKRKKTHNPNPLSCKKKQTTNASSDVCSSVNNDVVHRRRKKKLHRSSQPLPEAMTR